MERSNLLKQQIAFALRQAETGTRVEEVCRKMGISEATFYPDKSGEEKIWWFRCV